jgi:SAM-dependent methyltransferase
VRLDAIFYRLAYRGGKPRWDTGEPRPELRALAGKGGRALDLGCGTGTDAIYLAQRGWQVVGVDFVPEAIATAGARAREAGAAATFVVGDVTRLRELGVQGPFDLVIDIGCYHGIPAGRRDAYAAEVAAVARPGADFYLAGVSHPPAAWRLMGAGGVTADDIQKRFGAFFDLVAEEKSGGMGRASAFVFFHLVRR